MGRYETLYKDTYVSFNGKQIHTREKLAECINDGWIYSMYWEDDADIWIKQAQHDLESRLKHHAKVAIELSLAQAILNKLEGV